MFCFQLFFSSVGAVAIAGLGALRAAVQGVSAPLGTPISAARGQWARRPHQAFPFPFPPAPRGRVRAGIVGLSLSPPCRGASPASALPPLVPRASSAAVKAALSAPSGTRGVPAPDTFGQLRPPQRDGLGQQSCSFLGVSVTIQEPKFHSSSFPSAVRGAPGMSFHPPTIPLQKVLTL